MDHSHPRADGYAIRAKYLLEAQSASGHEVTVLTSPSQGANESDVVNAGVQYYRSGYTRLETIAVARGAKHAVFGRAITRSLRALTEARPFDVIHAHTPFTVARVALAEARRKNLPFVYEKRNLWEESARARGKTSGKWPWYQLAQKMDRWITIRADAVCTITEALRQKTVMLGAASDRVFVVGNGVDTDAFTPCVPKPEIRSLCAADGAFVIGFIGSFFSFEGLPLLVEAFARLCRRYPNARLVLVGDGEDFDKVKQIISAKSLESRVWLVGRVPHTDVLNYYASMEALVYPRYPSALTNMISPLKPLESMAMARCVIGSDVGGIAELVRDGETGLLFTAGSCDALVEKLELLMNGTIDAARLGENARKFVVAKRQWQHMAKAYEHAYERASSQRAIQR
jgi:glycogen synthase